MEPGPVRTAELTAWLQGAFADPVEIPVLVGGGAVELYTGGAYTTGDLDFVGQLGAAAEALLREAGFRRIGRHWKHEAAQLFIEFPARTLQGGAIATELRAYGRTVRVISPEDALVDRLAGWKFWESDEDAINAYLLYRAVGPRLDRRRLESRAAQEQVEDELRAVARFAAETEDREPAEEELRAWTRRNP